jgi:hypothetical protein
MFGITTPSLEIPISRAATVTLALQDHLQSGPQHPRNERDPTILEVSLVVRYSGRWVLVDQELEDDIVARSNRGF